MGKKDTTDALNDEDTHNRIFESVCYRIFCVNLIYGVEVREFRCCGTPIDRFANSLRIADIGYDQGIVIR